MTREETRREDVVLEAGVLEAGVPQDAGARVIVCGLGELGARIVELLDDAGLNVTVVDARAELGSRSTRSVGGPRVRVLREDAALPGVLGRAGLADAVAVICVEAEDLRNLQLALLVREQRPELRVVTALGNAAVGRALSDRSGLDTEVRREVGVDTVLDVAALATPTVVEACVASPVHELDVAGLGFLVAATDAGRLDRLRGLYGDLVPLAVTHTGPPTETVVCPGRDHVVQPGDRVTLLGTPKELSRAGVATTPPSPDHRVTRRGGGREPDSARGGVRAGRRALAVLVQIARESERGIVWALVALIGLIAVSTVVLRLGYSDPGMTWVDSLYFTVEAVATVGFGDYSFAHQALWLRLWAVFLMLAGVVATAVPIAFVTDVLISRRLSATAGRRRALGARGHVVLVGLGAVGLSVLTELQVRGRDVVVVERDHANRNLDAARAMNVPVVFGDATTAEALAAARVRRAGAVAILTSDDMDNIETGLAVRDLLGPEWTAVPVVLRMVDRELAGTVGRRFGFSAVHSVVQLAAPRFVGAALGLDVLGSFPVHRETFLLGRLVVGAHGGLNGLAMQELSERTRVVALRRAASSGAGGRADGALEHPPRRDTRFSAGDEAYVVGPYSELLDLLRRQRAPRA